MGGSLSPSAHCPGSSLRAQTTPERSFLTLETLLEVRRLCMNDRKGEEWEERQGSGGGWGGGKTPGQVRRVWTSG